MTHLAKLGNIKVGGTENGLPQQYQTLKVTKCNKNGEENFETFPGFKEEGNDELGIMLPFINDLKNSFEVGKLSFITINETIKYYAKEIDANIYLIPLQPNFKNPLIELPVIKLGTSEEWSDKLDLKLRALLYCYLPVDNSLEFYGNGTGVFHFKTSSAHAIEEINNTLRLLQSVNKDLLRMCNLTLQVHTKLVKMGDIEEVSYVRLLPPTPNKLNSASYALNNFPHVKEYLEGIETTVTSSKEQAISQAISKDEAEKFFNGGFILKLDNAANFELTPPITANQPTAQITEEESEILEEAQKLADESKLPLPMVKTLVAKKGLEETKAIIEKEKTVENIIKYIATIGQ